MVNMSVLILIRSLSLVVAALLLEKVKIVRRYKAHGMLVVNRVIALVCVKLVFYSGFSSEAFSLLMRQWLSFGIRQDLLRRPLKLFTYFTLNSVLLILLILHQKLDIFIPIYHFPWIRFLSDISVDIFG